MKPAKEQGIPAGHYGLLWLPVIVFFVLLSGLSVFYIWERLHTKEINRQIVELEQARRALNEENSQLRAKAEELSSYHRIYQIATERFGFIELEPTIIVSPEQK